TVGDLRDLRSWDVTTGKLLEPRKLPGGPGAGLTLSPDGKLLVGYTDQKFVIWELESAKQLAEWPAPGRRWGYFHLSADGQTLVALLTDSKVLLWDRKKGQQREINLPPNDPKNPFGIQQFDSSNHACLSPDGKLLATGVGVQSSLCLWDVATAQEVRRFDCDAPISAFSHDGNHLAPDGAHSEQDNHRNVLHLWD